MKCCSFVLFNVNLMFIFRGMRYEIGVTGVYSGNRCFHFWSLLLMQGKISNATKLSNCSIYIFNAFRRKNVRYYDSIRLLSVKTNNAQQYPLVVPFYHYDRQTCRQTYVNLASMVNCLYCYWCEICVKNLIVS